MRAYELKELAGLNFETIAQDLFKNHESIGWERRDYKQATGRPEPAVATGTAQLVACVAACNL